jgi:hypothetical protein
MVEKQKSIAELTAELDAIADIPVDFEQPTDVQVKPQPNPNNIIETVKPNLTAQSPPQIQIQVQPLQTNPVEATNPKEPAIEQPKLLVKERPSFDNMLERIKQKKFKQIEDEAVAKKTQAEDGLYDGLAALIELAANGKSFLPSISASVQQPEPVKVVVKDNSEAVRLIDLQLMDNRVQNKVVLLKLKRELQGQPFTTEDSVMYSESEAPLNQVRLKKAVVKADKSYSGKTGLAIGISVFGITIAIYFIVMALGVFH